MVHADVAAWGRAHRRPQAPQLARLVVVSVSQPLDSTPSQSPQPMEHVTTLHVLAVQPSVTVLARRHGLPHIPQLAGSLDVFAQ